MATHGRQHPYFINSKLSPYQRASIIMSYVHSFFTSKTFHRQHCRPNGRKYLYMKYNRTPSTIRQFGRDGSKFSILPTWQCFQSWRHQDSLQVVNLKWQLDTYSQLLRGEIYNNPRDTKTSSTIISTRLRPLHVISRKNTPES